MFYRVSDQELAEDLTAEVFVRMIDKMRTFTQQDRPILAWLYTIAHNLVVDHYRENKAIVQLPLKETLISEDSNPPVKSTENRLTQESLAKALNHLTEEQRQVILLKIIEERENAEVAAILGKSERAIQSLQHRALAILHCVLEKEYDFYGS